jgi:cold shock CspA family protein
MWAIVGHWVADRDGGFGVVTTESCEQFVVRDAVIESDSPLRTGDRVWLEFVDGGDCGEVVKLVKAR